MIADIFYPIFTLMITILACFIRKKKGKLFWGFAPSCSPRYCPGLHGGGEKGGLQLAPDPPASQSFLAFPRTDAPIFFLSHPLKVTDLRIKNLLSWQNTLSDR